MRWCCCVHAPAQRSSCRCPRAQESHQEPPAAHGYVRSLVPAVCNAVRRVETKFMPLPWFPDRTNRHHHVRLAAPGARSVLTLPADPHHSRLRRPSDQQELRVSGRARTHACPHPPDGAHRYPSVDHYYADGSSARYVAQVRRLQRVRARKGRSVLWAADPHSDVLPQRERRPDLLASGGAAVRRPVSSPTRRAGHSVRA